MHAALDHGDQLLELLAHSLSENILLLLYLEALHTNLCLICHSSDKLQGTDSTLPFARLLSQILDQHREQAENLGLGAQVVEERIKGVLGALLDSPCLVGQCVQGQYDGALLLDKEDNLCEPLHWRQLLEQSAECVHGTLALSWVLLIASGLLDLVENAIALEAAEADRVLQEGDEGIGGLDRAVRQFRSEYAVQDGGDIFMRGRGGVAGLAHNDRGGHGRRLGMGHARTYKGLCAVEVRLRGVRESRRGALNWNF